MRRLLVRQKVLKKHYVINSMFTFCTKRRNVGEDANISKKKVREKNKEMKIVRKIDQNLLDFEMDKVFILPLLLVLCTLTINIF